MSLTDNDLATAPAVESSSSAVSWAPIIGGSVAAAAITVLLMLLGSGFGFSMVSPWASNNPSLTTFAVSTGIWLVLIQWLSAGIGGYLTGRLRTKWTGVHTDEVYFRDTAHGFLSWALSTVLVAGLLSSAISATIGAGTQAVSTVASGTARAATSAATTTADNGTVSYFVNSLLRPTAQPQGNAANDANTGPEISGILLNAAASGAMPPEDRAYLEQVVAARTGLSPADAKSRVDAVLAQADAAKAKALDAADKARKAGATAAFMAAFSLLIGAFIASVAAALGGKQRDDDEVEYGALAANPTVPRAGIPS